MASSAPVPKTNAILRQAGYIEASKLCNTLQGSVWRATQKSTGMAVVIKITDKKLHANSMTIIDGAKYKVKENIKAEKHILKWLTANTKAKCPNSIVKYVDFFKSNFNFYLVRAHSYIAEGQITISEWHKLVKKIFVQMLEAVDYIHGQGICHFDLSLENFLMEDVPISVQYVGGKQTIRFDVERVQIRLIDFGLGQRFEMGSTFESKKFCGKPNYQSPEVTANIQFNAKSNDMFCLGDDVIVVALRHSVCLFCLCVGGMPWEQSSDSDMRFCRIMKGDTVKLLGEWHREHYVNDAILEVLRLLLRYEGDRVDLKGLRMCSWLKTREMPSPKKVGNEQSD